MAKSGKKTGVELEFSILDEEFRGSIKNMNTSLSSMKKEISLQNEVLKSTSATLDDYRKKIDLLNSQEEVSRQKVESTRAAYERTKAIMGENSTEALKYRDMLINAEAEHQKITNSIEQTTKSMINYENQLKQEEQANKNLNSSFNNLSSEIDNQKNHLEELKKQYINTVLEQGKGSTEAKRLKSEIKNLNSEIDDNETKLSKASSNLESFTNEEDKASEHSLKLGDIIKGNLISDAIKSGLKALADSVSSVASSFSSAMQNGASYADEILTLSTQTGLSTESLQKYKAVSELVDVSMETLTGSMAKNVKQMAAGNDSYKKLGVSITDVNGNLRNSEDVYWEAIDALGNIQNETERDALAMDLFGKSAQDLNPLIAQGSAGIKEFGNDAEYMGAVLSEDALFSLGELDDEMQRFSTVTSSTGKLISSAFAPGIADLIGGVNTLGSSFNHLISSVLSGDEGNIDQAINQFSESVSNLLSSISKKIPEMMNIANNLITTLINVISDNLPQILQMGLQLITTLLNGISNNLSTILPVIIEVIMGIVNAIIQNLPTILQAGIQVLLSLIEGIAQSLPTLIPTIVQAIITIVEAIIDNIDLIIDAGIDIIFGLIDGLINALPDLIDKIPEIIDKLIVAITENLPKIIEAGITLTIKIAEGLIKAIPQLVSKIPQIITSLINGIVNYFGKMVSIGGELLGKVKDGITNGISGLANIGKNLVQGLWNGINNAKNWVLDKIRGFGQSILNGLKSFFGIHSPSTVMQNIIGKNLALGVGEGWENNISTVQDDMVSSMDSLTDNLSTSINPTISSNITTATEDSLGNGEISPIYLTIENFYNNREQDIADLSEELAFYGMKNSYGKGLQV